jgi:hypothetical protein
MEAHFNLDKAIYYVGEAARPVTMLLTGIAFVLCALLPYVPVDKLLAVGGVVTAFFVVKGQDKREELRVTGEVDKAKAQAGGDVK